MGESNKYDLVKITPSATMQGSLPGVRTARVNKPGRSDRSRYKIMYHITFCEYKGDKPKVKGIDGIRCVPELKQSVLKIRMLGTVRIQHSLIILGQGR